MSEMRTIQQTFRKQNRQIEWNENFREKMVKVWVRLSSSADRNSGKMFHSGAVDGKMLF